MFGETPSTTTEPPPTTVSDQLTALADILTALVGQNLVGVYVANGHQNAEADSSYFLLIVIRRDLLRDRKYGLVQAFLHRSGQPAALEVLVVRQADLASEQASVLVQLQYTDELREHLLAEVGSPAWLQWVEGPTGAVDRGTLFSRLQASRALVGTPLTALLAVLQTEGKPAGDFSDRSPPSGGQQLMLGNP